MTYPTTPIVLDAEVEGDALCGAEINDPSDAPLPVTEALCKCGHSFYRHSGLDLVCQNPACECKGYDRAMLIVEGTPVHPKGGVGANARQVGGEHYGLTKIQHWDLVVMFNWDYFQGQIIKYVMRCKKKNGLQDLEKAQHYLEKYIEEIKAGKIKLEDGYTLEFK